MKKKKILVTGGLGFIGSHTVVELQKEGFEVIIIDDLSNTRIEVLDGIFEISKIRPEFVKLDLKEKEQVAAFFEEHKIAYLILNLGMTFSKDTKKESHAFTETK